MRYVSFVLAVTLLYPLVEKIVGTYVFESGQYRKVLRLNSDFTYFLETEGWVFDYISDGTWAANDSGIILNSRLQAGIVHVSECHVDSPGFFFKFYRYPAYDPLEAVSILVNSDTVLSDKSNAVATDSKGECYIVLDEPMHFFCASFFLEQYRYEPLDSTSNSFEVFAFFDALEPGYKSLIDEPMIFGENGLIDSHNRIFKKIK